ncbi:NAD(P)-dependent dehydrogenase (short-subunit alcohol dehydrogenase family) [Rhizobium rosettiformans]|jgi:NAD(P)-dependent dehydrogenase (short-subunit alcohol dehydrogenase family)|uniref:SDR family oxidoreductase n=2 Tax=Rhizobium rosettiformans TaxID=1368430 RepID=A0A4S8Q1K8_9HYPH|nr:SDR family NAD(P)-dependent oxidoreductase [Rhizobium rosettiformans]MBB5277351.1 NAD(P)-dependent dehydrogenase (short-subunit alcohol dehydrogenase family) [Rhizobium rosettiformans]THV34429.1 SDR family oxidoreductase [Rhizobium rosettiformans W3]
MNGAEFERDTALVTGAGSGIGKGAALRLAKGGAFVGLLGRTEDELEETLAEIRAGGGDGMVLVADVSQADQMAEAVGRLIDARKGLQIVVANAGINGTWAPIDDLKPEEFDKTIAINLRGTYLTLHHTVPFLKKTGGSIIVMSSINGTRTFTTPGATAYSATKAAQLAMVQQLALELGRHGIRINAICPGAIETEIDDNTNVRKKRQTEVPVEFPEGDIPLTGGESGTIEDIADVVAFLASDASRHVTGTPIWVDGGQSLLR